MPKPTIHIQLMMAMKTMRDKSLFNIVVAKNKGIKSMADKMLGVYHCYANRCKQEKIKLIMIILIYGDQLFLHWLTIHGCVHNMD